MFPFACCTYVLRSQFTEPKGYGIPLVVYSALLTRGVEEDGVSADMDQGFGECSMIGRHNYATQVRGLVVTSAAHRCLRVRSEWGSSLLALLPGTAREPYTSLQGTHLALHLPTHVDFRCSTTYRVLFGIFGWMLPLL